MTITPLNYSFLSGIEKCHEIVIQSLYSMNQLNTQSVALVMKAKSGDPDAFGELYRLYFTPVYRYILLRVGRASLADDMVQDVFLKAWRAVTRYEDTGKPFLAWLFTIARNTIYDFYRKKQDVLIHDILKDENEIADETPLFDPETERSAERMSVLHASLRLLSHDQQDVIALRFIEGRSHREIAGLIGKSEDAVRAIASRGLRELRRIIQTASFENETPS